MKSISFSIDSDLSLDSGFQYDAYIQCGAVSVYILGDAIGAILRSRVYDRCNMLKYIENNIADIERIREIVVNSIGAYYLLLLNSNSFYVLSSSSSPGLFYVRKDNLIYFYNSERDIIKDHGSLCNVNDDVVLDVLSSHHILLRAPHATIFDDIIRMPAGTALTVSGDLNVDTDILLMDAIPDSKYHASSVRNAVEQFGFLLENTLMLMIDYYGYENLELFFSGGIDSSVLLAALHKIYPQIKCNHLAYSGVKSQNVLIAKRIASHFNIDLNVIEKSSSPDLGFLVASSVSGLGTINVPQFLTTSVTGQSLGHAGIVNVITGQNADTLYHIDTFAPNSATFFPLKVIKTIRTVKYRSLFSDLFFSKKKIRSVLRVWPFCIKKEHLDYDFDEYLLSLVHSTDEHIAPLSRDGGVAQDQLSGNKYNYVYLPIYSCVNERYNLKSSSLSSLQRMSIARIFRWFRTVNNVSVNYHNNQLTSSVNRLLPYTDGPLANFFLKRPLTLSEMFFVKRILYSYFRKNLGRSYTSFCRYKYIDLLSIIRRKITNAFLGFSPDIDKSNSNSYKNEIEILNQMRLSEDKLILSLLSDKETKRMVSELYDLLEVGDKKLSKEQVMSLCRLVNLENMLYSLTEKCKARGLVPELDQCR